MTGELNVRDALLHELEEGLEPFAERATRIVLLTGPVRAWPDAVIAYDEALEVCPKCNGAGQIHVQGFSDKWPCWVCGGEGEARGYGRVLGDARYSLRVEAASLVGDTTEVKVVSDGEVDRVAVVDDRACEVLFTQSAQTQRVEAGSSEYVKPGRVSLMPEEHYPEGG